MKDSGVSVASAQLSHIRLLEASAFSCALHNALAGGGNLRPGELHETLAALIELAALGTEMSRCSLLHLERELSRVASRMAPLKTGAGPRLAELFAARRTGLAMLAEIARLRSAAQAETEPLAALNDRLRSILARLAGSATGREAR